MSAFGKIDIQVGLSRPTVNSNRGPEDNCACSALDLDMHHQAPNISLFSGSNEAPRCQAKSKRSGVQCRKAAMRGKRVCRTHGGASTGPRTPEGRQRCSDAKTVHGRETRAIRSKRDAKLRELRSLEHTMKAAGLIT